MVILKRSIAGIFYLGGISFFIFFLSLFLKSNFMFSTQGIMMCALGIFIPIAIGSFILISSLDDVNDRYKLMRIFVISMLVYYIIVLFYMLFWNGYRRFIATTSIGQYAHFNLNLIPLKTIGSYIQSFVDNSMNKPIIIENILGNIILSAPMGILLPCIFKNFRKFIKFLMIILITFTGIETAQLLTRTGRCDIDDVILNLVGAFLLWAVFRIKIVQKILNKVYILK